MQQRTTSFIVMLTNPVENQRFTGKILSFELIGFFHDLNYAQYDERNGLGPKSYAPQIEGKRF